VGAVDPDDIHTGVHERRDKLGVVGRLTGKRRHDPGRPARAHRAEDLVGVGVKDLVALV